MRALACMVLLTFGCEGPGDRAHATDTGHAPAKLGPGGGGAGGDALGAGGNAGSAGECWGGAMLAWPRDVSVEPQDGALAISWENRQPRSCAILISRSEGGGVLGVLASLPLASDSGCGPISESYLDATATDVDTEYCYVVGCQGWAGLDAAPVCGSP